MRRSLRALAVLGLALALPLASAGRAAADQPRTFRGSKLIPTPANNWCQERSANGGIGLKGKQLMLKSSSDAAKNELFFSSGKRQQPLLMSIDPRVGFHVVVTGSGGAADHSALAELEPGKWKRIKANGKSVGWVYKDKQGRAAGVRKVTLRDGQLEIQAKGEGWQFDLGGADEEISVHAEIGNQWYCATFGGEVEHNEIGFYKARGAEAPAACASAMCGNGVQDVGEQCDDGDLDDADGCANDCLQVACTGDGFTSTFEAIQSVILDRYGCTSALCHGQYNALTGEPTSHAVSGLVLLPSSAANLPQDNPMGIEGVLQRNHDALINSAPTHTVSYDHFVVPGDTKTSLLYQALYKKVNCLGEEPPLQCDSIEPTVSDMPKGVLFGISPEELAAVGLWLRAGAPIDASIAGTADKLSACLPPATPLKIEPPPAPGEGNGVQLRSSAWSLPQHSENEVCFPLYYDLTQTNLIPEDQQFDCGDTFGPTNSSHKCFRWEKQLLVQDPQSHHSIIHLYTGQYGLDDPAWGAWTYKGDAVDDPRNGQTCDPRAIDPSKGFNEGCSGNPVRSAACLAYGPPDFNAGGFTEDGITAPQFSGSQETHYQQELADGVYAVLPMTGVVVWNSHAFNLTATDTTMNQYLNLYVAGPNHQSWPTRQIFDADDIFIQDVPAFDSREYCATFTIPDGANLFWLSSHTHRHGVRWRTWSPPNPSCDSGSACTPVCDPGSPGCTCDPGTVCAPPGPAGDDRLVYFSSIYNDPVQLEIKPPVLMTGSPADRRFLFCANYDNGSTPSSPPVKRQSTSPETPFLIGGPCGDEKKTCISPDPAKKGQLCAAQPDPDRFCDSSPGAFNGFCDACPLHGGFTTEDEMFILLGNYFVP